MLSEILNLLNSVKNMLLEKSSFGKVNGKATTLYSVKDVKSGFEVAVSDFGATLVRVKTPDKNGKVEDINFGQHNAEEFTTGGGYLGAVVGRVGNRIKNANFTLEGKTYSLYVNNANLHSLHGGKEGFNFKIWNCKKSEVNSKGDIAEIEFDYVSKDGEEGYPGTLNVTVTYIIKPMELAWTFKATTNKTTIINLTNHAYWNLEGLEPLIDNQELRLLTSRYMEGDENNMVTGEEKACAGKADWHNFTSFSKIFKEFGDVDNNFFIEGVDKKKDPKEVILCAEVYSPKSGRLMKVETSEPCVQIYTGNYMMNVKSFGKQCKKHQAVCLETQRPPNAINIPKYSSMVILKPNETYFHKTVHKFSIN